MGPKLELHDCTVISETDGRRMVFAGLRMYGGIFNQKQALKNFHFQGARFLRVRLVGKYSGFHESFHLGDRIFVGDTRRNHF